MTAAFAAALPLRFKAVEAAIKFDADNAHSPQYPPLVPGTIFSCAQINVGLRAHCGPEGPITTSSKRNGDGVVVHRDLHGVKGSVMLLLEVLQCFFFNLFGCVVQCKTPLSMSTGDEAGGRTQHRTACAK